MNDNHELLTLLEKKKSLFNQILEITKNQSRILLEEDITPINDSLDSRQQLFCVVDEIDDSLTSLMEDYKSFDALRPQLDELQDILSEIIKCDKANLKRALSISNGLKNNMQKISAGRIQNKSYERAISYGASYFDQIK